ncbi:rod shape-determining protein MreC [Paenibacillus sp. YPG26]|uniref:rod shape-determining protein MreC n=1 Tax=Paenibacillus sp. YPG26 TaxID=2878915 RepID=UPI00203BE1BB|nr:rod shape-determining protein MreC [Paenibacillus sp. YPG26]USB34253.1 rod shape-determining protein MreC [Paenibacillus sp. YPG26]
MLELFKLLGNKRLFILLIGLILFVAVMGFTLGPRAGLSWPEKFIKDTVGFVQSVFYKPARAVAGFFEDISNLHSLQEENRELKIMMAHYSREMPKIIALQTQVESLQNDLKFTEAQKNSNKFDLAIVDVVSVNNDPANRTLVINRGSNDKIRKGLSVISDKGMVGIVSEVSNFTSTVKLLTSMDSRDITSPGMAATAVGKENTSFGIIEDFDQQTGTFLMTKINQNDPLAKGDQIVTSGAGGAFPKNLPIGTVVSRQAGNGLTATASIKPAASFENWKSLFVVITWEVPK